jgi:hypothetical protein
VRRAWSQKDLEEIKRALPVTSSEEIARRFGVKVKSLRSVLRRYQISIRHTRRSGRPRRAVEGLRVRRSASGAAATYGAEALAQLPDHACRWPIGDPAKPDFRYCGALRASVLSSYCATHREKAHSPAQAQD